MQAVWGYVRVSAIEQESGYGPEVQEEKIRDYCRAQDLPDPEIIHESRSGESIVERHELNLMFARAEAAVEGGMEAHVVFPWLDRLSRNLIDQETVVLRSQGQGVRLHSTLASENDTLDPAFSDDPMRVAIRQFWGIINQLDRAIIQRRLDGGLARKASTGGFTGGRPPFGYRVVNKDLQIDPERSPVVRRVFALKSRGIDQATTVAVVAREYPIECGHWHKRQIGRLLNREALYRHGRYRPRTGSQEVERPELIILDDDDEGDRDPTPAEGIDWGRMPDTVTVPALAVLLGVSPDRLRSVISENRIVARHRKGSIFVSRDQARHLRSLMVESPD